MKTQSQLPGEAFSLELKPLLDELGLVAWPKTSSSRGMHINIRIHPGWTFTEVRCAALALARTSSAAARSSPAKLGFLCSAL